MRTYPPGEVLIPPPTRLNPREWFYCSPPIDTDPFWTHAWDVTRANFIMFTEARKGTEHLLRRFAMFDLTPGGRNWTHLRNSATWDELDQDYVRGDQVNPNVPVVATEAGGMHWIIDGWHRAARAMAMGWTEICVFGLTPDEDLRCRICPCCLKEPHPLADLVARTIAEAPPSRPAVAR